MTACVCGTANSESAKFCAGCGRALGCPACGADLPPGAKFCSGCGAVAGAATRPPSPPPASGPRTAWTLRRILGPIVSIAQATDLARAAAIACAFIALVELGLNLTDLPGAARVATALGFLCVLANAGCAFGLWRGQSWAGLLSLVIYPAAILAGLDLMDHVRGSTPSANPLNWLIVLMTFAVLPAVLVNGLRACMGWNRFRRGEATPSEIP